MKLLGSLGSPYVRKVRVVLAEKELKPTAKAVERLMGTKAEARFEFIQEKAAFASEASLDL